MTETQQQKKSEPVRLPKAKRSALINTITAEIRGAQLRRTVTVSGRTYTLATLSPKEETWANTKVPGVTPIAVARNQKAPFSAVALRAIDGVPVEQHFQLPDASEMDPDLHAAIVADKELLEEWRKEQILEWLQLDSSSEIVAALFGLYSEMTLEREAALKVMRPFSKESSTMA
jgi:hypothetical protein